MTTKDQANKPKFPALETLTPEQLQRLSKAHRKRGMKQTANPVERKRLFQMSNRVDLAAKLKANRLAKEKESEPSQTT